jgi:hypothetical protein
MTDEAMTEPTPGTPQWTWTYEAREAAVAALLNARWPDGSYVDKVTQRTADRYLAPAVLAALAPLVAAAVAEAGRRAIELPGPDLADG